MLIRLHHLLLLLAALIAATPAAAAPHIVPSLVAESSRPAPGRAVMLALKMRPAKGWHGYWKNPGDSGVETTVDWRLPPGVKAGPLDYPVPHALLIAGLMNYVYEADYAHLIRLEVPAGIVPGTPLPIRGTARWLACTEEICVPEQAEIALDLTVGDGAADKAADFDRWRAALPRPLGSEGRFVIAGGKVRLAVPLPATMRVTEPYFFPLTDGAIDYAAPQSITRNGDTLVIETRAPSGGSTPGTIEGVLKIGGNEGLALTARPGTVPATGTPITATAEEQGKSGATLLAALGGAILGGLLLNLMPCVFPILSLKALSLARSGESERTARLEALAYSVGVILVCMGLGALLLALRASGATAGWGFQLQDPRVILFLLLLVAAIALNLAGLFELPSITSGGGLAARGGTGGAFWTGALAAVIATPCTGPFMGVALGAALVLPAAAALAVFAGLGLGIALPFLALGFVPALRRRLPRPGAWMERFRRILSLPMFMTALGLAWILGQLAGVDGMTLGLGAALLLAVALWWVGIRQARGRTGSWWPLAPAALAAALLVAIVPRAPAGASPVLSSVGPLAAEPFSETRLAALRAEGRPVFVYFTADWCLTCKVNEKAAIERAEVAQAFAARKVAVLMGDWTRGDPAISRFLSAQGRSGVPLYLFYAPGKDAATLPQVLTPGTLTALAT